MLAKNLKNCGFLLDERCRRGGVNYSSNWCMIFLSDLSVETHNVKFYEFWAEYGGCCLGDDPYMSAKGQKCIIYVLI